MNGTIRQAAALSATERAVLFGAEPDPFGVAHLGLQWRPKDIHFLLELDGEPIAHVGVLQHDVRTEHSSVHLAGLGGVITAAEARGQGHATALIRHAIGHALESWGADAALLFCLPGLVSFYRRQGFQLVTTEVLVEQPAGQFLAPLPVMVRSLHDRIWPQGPITLGSLPW